MALRAHDEPSGLTIPALLAAAAALAPDAPALLAPGDESLTYGRLHERTAVVATMDNWTPREVWEGLADEIRWHELAVPHGTLFQQPNADTLGALLTRVIDDGLREEGSS